MRQTTTRNRSFLVKVVLGILGVFSIGLLIFFFMLIATDPGDNLVLVEVGFANSQLGSRVVTGTVNTITYSN